MNELIAHIKALNAKTLAWVAEDPTNRWAGTLVEEAAHWEKQGITTVEQFERSMLISEISDAYKERNGFRPRRDWSAMTLAELKDYYDFITAPEVAYDD